MVQRRGVQKISFVAHSLGGLVARYAIGRLYEQPSQFDSNINEGSGGKGLIAGLVPMNFITFASPHLGSRGNKQVRCAVLPGYFAFLWSFLFVRLLD